MFPSSSPLPLAGLEVRALAHPQGCRAWLVASPDAAEALVVDPHLDMVPDLLRDVAAMGVRVRWILDTHTHADHPSGAAALAARTGGVRVAHAQARHAGVTHFPDDGEPLALGPVEVVVRHGPGHTPDHLLALVPGAVLTGDSLLLGSVARADFLGGDAGKLYDTIHDVVLALPDDTLVLPGHDYAQRSHGTVGGERSTNPWLQLPDRDAFVRALSANPPPEPANMAALLRLNREGVHIPSQISAEEVVAIVRRGGAATIIDVRTPEEVRAAHVPGSRHILMDTIPQRLDDVLRTPAPRLLLCRVGNRAEVVRRYLANQGVGGCATIVGGIDAFAAAGGEIEGGLLGQVAPGGACAADGPGGGCAATPPSA